MKRCATCKRKFDDTDCPEFITCTRCRRPLPPDVDVGGCHFWKDAAPDPRVSKHGNTDFSINENHI